MNWQGKKILFFSAAFFDYEKVIVQRLEKWGAKVEYHNERPSDNLLAKGIIRVNRKFYKKKIKNYYQKIVLATSEKKYDFLLMIKAETVPEFFLKRFKEKHPETILIFYSYDPISEYPDVKNILHYFDKKLSFDKQDCLDYNMQFRPLFFNEIYLNENDKNSNPKYDISFIGSAHTDRFLVGEKLLDITKKEKLTTHFYYYSPSKSVLLLKRIFDAQFKKIDVEKVRYKKLNHQEIAEIYANSKAVLDIQKPFQNGLTMRTFEVLASGTKLITTNKDIANYPFYDSNNVLIIDRENPIVPKDFFSTPFKPISKENLQKMTLNSWLEEVFL